MPKTEPDEQYTPKGYKIPIPEKGEFRRNLDKLIKADQPAPRAQKAPQQEPEKKPTRKPPEPVPGEKREKPKPQKPTWPPPPDTVKKRR
jgi:hypothetical protein